MVITVCFLNSIFNQTVVSEVLSNIPIFLTLPIDEDGAFFGIEVVGLPTTMFIDGI